MSPEERLAQLGLALPSPPAPVAAYVPAIVVGKLVFVSGQGPIRDGKPAYQGVVGADLSEEQGYAAARLAALNALAVLKAELSSLSEVRRVVKLTGWVRSATGFGRQPFVINGASELLEAVFGDAGKHARTAIGTSELPFGIPVEVELIVAIG
ncbi:RidA family protein [Geochorda subterranea]|uniref:RidA family protein n=1 Tax=Geochorda subterranea TaxID=3109564 RepID=A0ABZ1BP62_9FIRM|nr:RidA family protein [Limnochorda sp. LNt]WRP14474.1 RidA family protein [Limnochorda sp. LNt]